MLVFRPHSRAGEIALLTYAEAVCLVTDAKLGEGASVEASRPKLLDERWHHINGTQAEVISLLHRELKTGHLDAVCQMGRDAVIYAIPREYWGESAESLVGGLSPTIWSFELDGRIPQWLQNASVLFIREQVERFAAELSADARPAPHAKAPLRRGSKPGPNPDKMQAKLRPLFVARHEQIASCRSDNERYNYVKTVWETSSACKGPAPSKGTINAHWERYLRNLS